MASSLVPFEVPASVLAELGDIFGPTQSNKDLTEGVQPSFAVVTFRGKVWRVRYKSEDRIVKHPETGEPVQSVIGVIVKSSPAISKIYYPKSYSEGDDAPPACFSLDGVKPDLSATDPQNATCAACPHNVFGSRITESGGKAKACSDNRRLALVPYPDLRNETFGGPMLLRVPPTSLVELARLGDTLKQSGLPYQAIVVKISFDYDLAYPKLVFTAVRALSKDEAMIVLEHMNSDAVTRMLMEPVAGDETTGEPVAGTVEPRPAKVVSSTPPEPKAAPEPAQAPPAEEKKKVSPAKAATAPAEVISSELDSMVSNLLNA